MAAITGFEEIEGWKTARVLVREIYDITKNNVFKSDYGLKDQIRRAAVSVMSNIAEGFERKSRAEFARFLLISKGSLAEVKSQLYVAMDLGYIEGTDFKRLYSIADETGKKIYGFYLYLKKFSKK